MIRLFMIVLLVLLVPQRAAFAVPAQAAGFDHSTRDTLLKKHVTPCAAGKQRKIPEQNLLNGIAQSQQSGAP